MRDERIVAIADLAEKQEGPLHERAGIPAPSTKVPRE